MRIATIADIHGNLFALKSVLSDCESKGIDQFIFLGDYITDGPFSNEVLDMIRSIDAIVVKGNREDLLIDLKPDLAIFKQLEVAFWTRNRLRKDNLDYIHSMNENVHCQIEGISFHISHHPAYHHKHENGVYDVVEVWKILQQSSADIELFGHTHRPLNFKQNGQYVINPGSCGLDLSGDNRAFYGIITIDNDTINYEHCGCKYDTQAYLASFHSTGMLNDCPAWTKCTMRSISTGNNYYLDFLLFARSLMSEHDRPTNGLIDNDIWDLAEEQYDFEKMLPPEIVPEDITQ